MTRVLQALLWVVAVVAIATGAVVFLGGARAYPLIDTASPSADSELRFFAAFWMGYGGLAGWVARDLPNRAAFVPPMAWCMVLGAVGRGLSYAMVGSPGAGLVLAIGIEVAFGAALLASSSRRERNV